MKDAEEVERMIAGLSIEPGAEADDRILADAAAALAQPAAATSQQAIGPEAPVAPRRRAMGIIVALAAAVIVFVGAFFWLTPRPKPETSAYAQLENALKNSRGADYVHFKVSLEGKAQAECWTSFGAARTAVKTPGTLIYEDKSAQKEYVFDSASMTIRVTTKPPGAIQDNLSGVLSEALTGIDEALRRDMKVSKATRLVGQRLLDVYTVEDTLAGTSYTVAVDPLSSRIVQLASAPLPGAPKSTVSDLAIDYPASMPADIYALGAPRWAKVIEG